MKKLILVLTFILLLFLCFLTLNNHKSTDDISNDDALRQQIKILDNEINKSNNKIAELKENNQEKVETLESWQVRLKEIDF